MSVPVTPKKRKMEEDAIPASPGPNRTLEFDFWTEREGKVPKVVQQDLEHCSLIDLQPTKCYTNSISVRCIKVLTNAKVFKVALADVTGMMIAVSFGEEGIALNRLIQPCNWYRLSNFEVRNENPEFLSGAVNKLQIILKPSVTTVEKLEIEDDLGVNIRTVEEIKLLPDNTLVDMLCVCVKEWGQSFATNGTPRCEIALTDQSKACTRLTAWAQEVNQLVGCKGKVILVKRAAVSSYQGIKCVQTKWFSDVVVEPDVSEAKDLIKWFREELDQIDK